MRQVEGIKVHVLKIYPSAKSVRTVHEELIPVMVSLSSAMIATISYSLILDDHG